jgi:hypothetical protein
MPETVQPVIDRALSAYADLVGLGESIEDEWSYVNDLAEAWNQRLAEVGELRGPEQISPAVGGAVDRAITEIGLITDPHRAIDWLSTFPQVVLLALDEAP